MTVACRGSIQLAARNDSARCGIGQEDLDAPLGVAAPARSATLPLPNRGAAARARRRGALAGAQIQHCCAGSPNGDGAAVTGLRPRSMRRARIHANARVRFVGSALPPCACVPMQNRRRANCAALLLVVPTREPRRTRRWTFLLSLRMGQSPFRSSSLAMGRRVGRRVSRGVTRRPPCVARAVRITASHQSDSVARELPCRLCPASGRLLTGSRC